VALRAGVIASNDPTASDAQMPATAATPTAEPTVGALLRERREKSGLSPGDIATKLRMGLRQVTALENSDYAALPTGTFLRGFVRNYAKAVGLNAEEVLGLLEKTHRGAAAVKASPVVVPNQQNIRVPAPGGKLATPNGRALAVGAVLMLLLAAAWYWLEYVLPHRVEGGRASARATQSIALPQSAIPTPAAAPATESSPPTAVMATTDGAALSPSSGSPATAAMTGDAGSNHSAQLPVAVPPPDLPPVTAGANEAKAPPSRSPAVAAGRAALSFSFTGESWVEVVDGSGRTILSRRFKAGDAEETVGRVPFSVVIGNAKLTRMLFEGQEFDLGPHTRGAVARVTLK
jgi:cytoskeleton protein RodZ